MKRHATTLILLLATLVLVVVLWRDKDKVTSGERQRRENNVFSAWRRDELSRIEVRHEGETILLARNAQADGTWRMESPRTERADHAAVERLLTTLEFATVVRKISSDEGGFDRPRASGTLTMGNLVLHFVLGGVSPRPEGSGYLRVDDGPPFVASKELVDALLERSEAYRDRTVIPYLSLELERFEVTHPAGGFTLDRADDRSFKVHGTGLLASRSAVDKVWSALAEIRAEAFPKDADADALTARPRLSMRMTPKDASKPAGELVVGEACPGHPDDVVVLRKAPTRVAACAPRGALDALVLVTPDGLVDRRPFSFRADEIEELRLEALGEVADAGAGAGAGAPRVIEIARRGTGFHEREPEDRELPPAEADAASELLGRLELASADAVRPAAGEAFHAVARARVRSGEHDETVEVGEPTPGDAVLRRVRDDARLVVSKAVARRLVPRATTLRSRTLLAETRRPHGVVLRCGTPQDFVDTGAGLKLTGPYETDGSIVQLVDAVSKGKVLAWVADADDGSFGLDARSDCRVIVTYEDGNAPTTIRLGSDGEGGVYGVVDGSPAVFSAAPSLRTLIQRIYVDHAALRVEAGRIESVKVSGRATATNAPARDVDTLRAAVAGLYADEAVALGTTDVGPVELEITVLRTESGPPKTIRCGPLLTATGSPRRRCATPEVKAVFEVQAARLGKLFAGAR